MLKGYKYEIAAANNGFQRRQRSLAGAFDSGSSGNRTANITATGIQGFFTKPLMEGIVQETTPETVRMLCRDAYRYDAISGATVDLLSILPWSNVTLSGIKDAKVLEKYTQSISNMNLMMLMPELTVDYLVNGAFISKNIFDTNKGIYTGIAPQAIDSCDIMPVPVYGRDPLINVRFSEHFKKLLMLAREDDRAKNILKDLGDNFETNLRKGYIALDPETTTYIPRRSFATEVHGTSFLQRIIPYWIIEKALLRGTIELSYRRQKSLLHLIIGDEEWEPTNDELANFVNLFLQADQDPTGAIVATRPGVVPTELGSSSGFWRIDEIQQSTNEVKYKALGVSESMLSGDANLNTLDTAMSTFLERLKYMRFSITQSLFYNKLFPHIAVSNNFRAKKDEMRHEVQGRYSDNGFQYEEIARADYESKEDYEIRRNLFSGAGVVSSRPNYVYSEKFDAADYQMPKINWIKNLKPEADSAYMDVLEKLEDKGLPIPLRVWAAAGGVNIAEMIYGYEDDIKLRKITASHKKKLPKNKEDDGSGEFASALGDENTFVESLRDPARRRQLGMELLLASSAKPKPLGLGRRTFDERHLEMKDPDTGKVLSRKGRAVKVERLHKTVAEAASRIAQRDNYAIKNSKDDIRKRLISYGDIKPMKKERRNGHKLSFTAKVSA